MRLSRIGLGISKALLLGREDGVMEKQRPEHKLGEEYSGRIIRGVRRKIDACGPTLNGKIGCET